MVKLPDRSIYQTERAAQGEYGEQLVNEFYTNKGYDVFTNIDINGGIDTIIMKDDEFETLQIKACVRYVTKDKIGLHIGPTLKAYETIQKCDHLICVIRHPSVMIDYAFGGKIIKVVNHKKYKVSKDGNLWFPTNSSSVQIIGSISDEELEILSSFKTSK